MKLKKNLGQHLLNNQSILDKIAAMANTETVIEIGPGTGNLTEYLLKNINIKRLILVEKDPDMIEKLKLRFNDDRLEIYNQDATILSLKDFNLTQKTSVIGNFPYNVGNSIIINLVEQIEHITKIVAMLQKEVVQRFCATPKTKDYGKLTVLCGTFCTAKKTMDIGPNNFTPPPKVMSSILELIPKEQNITKEQYQEIIKFCNIGFGNRRKKLIPLLKQHFDTEQISKIIPILPNENVRIEELSIEKIIEIIKMNCK